MSSKTVGLEVKTAGVQKTHSNKESVLFLNYSSYRRLRKLNLRYSLFDQKTAQRAAGTNFILRSRHLATNQAYLTSDKALRIAFHRLPSLLLRQINSKRQFCSSLFCRFRGGTVALTAAQVPSTVFVQAPVSESTNSFE